MRYARGPTLEIATLLAQSALAHPENPVLARLGERLSQQVAQGQRADGTCQGATGWTLQRLLVTTVECVKAARAFEGTAAAKQRGTAVQIKASGAFERNIGRVSDGYTAAALLTSGALSDTTSQALKKLLLSKIETLPDGQATLKPEDNIVRPDGASPSEIEATAMAILALPGDPLAVALGTQLLSNYNPYLGFGDGRTNLIALQAVIQLFATKVPSSVKIILERDGQQIGTSTFDAAALKDVMSLESEAAGSSGKHFWKVSAEPAVAGLGFSLNVVAFTPFQDEPGGGLDLKIQAPAHFKVGQKSQLQLAIAAPAGIELALKLGLPAGVQVDAESLTNLVSNGTLGRFETEDGSVTLHLPAARPGAIQQLPLTVVPTLAGRLSAAETSLTPEQSRGQGKNFAPQKWAIDP
jgi:hypothetical protein